MTMMRASVIMATALFDSLLCLTAISMPNSQSLPARRNVCAGFEGSTMFSGYCAVATFACGERGALEFSGCDLDRYTLLDHRHRDHYPKRRLTLDDDSLDACKWASRDSNAFSHHEAVRFGTPQVQTTAENLDLETGKRARNETHSAV
jgi:hypothetical protein